MNLSRTQRGALDRRTQSEADAPDAVHQRIFSCFDSRAYVRFLLFADSAHDVRLVSKTFVPGRIGLSDGRELEVALYGLAFVGSSGEARRVSLDAPRLGEGLHGEEASSGAYWRWTKGELVLDPQFWVDLTGPIALFVNHNAQVTRGWIRRPDPRKSFPSRARANRGSIRLVTRGGLYLSQSDRRPLASRLKRLPMRRSFFLRRVR